MELDGVLVNDDAGKGSRWLRSRMKLLPAPLPVASYSGRHPQREATIQAGVDRIGLEAHPTAVER